MLGCTSNKKIIRSISPIRKSTRNQTSYKIVSAKSRGTIFARVFLLPLVFPVLIVFSGNAIADSVKLEKGKRVYDQTCVFCHQADAIGKPGVAPSLSNKELLSIATDKFLAETIRDGRPGTGMPPFSYLGDDVINSVVFYLRSLATLPSRAKKVAAQPKSKGNWQRGKKEFNGVCMGCHGSKGNGYRAGGTGTAIGKLGFLSKVSDGFIRTTIKEGRSNTRMRSFQGSEGLANLSDQEIEDIIAYLRTVPSKD